MRRYKFAITTDGAGAATVTDPEGAPSGALYGGDALLYAVEWIDGDLADGVDAVLSMTNTNSGVDTTLLTLTNANNDAWYYPRVAEVNSAAAATGTYAMPVVSGMLKLVVSNGGPAKTGGCVVYLMDV